jgi:replicative DNA helicase
MTSDYQEYLNSPEWQEVRLVALKRSGNKCQICGSKHNLDVHHNSYANLGNEHKHLEDLIVLCAEHHFLYHDALLEIEKLSDQKLEERLLGALLQQPPGLIEALYHLPINIFTSSLRQKIFDYLRSRAMEGRTTDSVLLSSYVANQNLLEAQEIENLIDTWISCCPNPQNAEAYAEELHDLYLRRKLQTLPAKIIKLNRTGKNKVIDIVNEIQGSLQEINYKSSRNRLLPLEDILAHAFVEIERRSLGEVLPGLSCGFFDLDRMTQGFQRSDLIIVAGRPSMGKTALSMQIARQIAEIHEMPVCIFSLEMSKEQITTRLLASESGIDSNYLRAGRIHESQWEPLSRAIETLNHLPIYIDENSNPHISEIRAKAQQVMFDNKGSLGLIVIDYLQLIGSDSYGSRTLEISKITQELKALAKDLNVPIIVLSQLSRNVESRTNKRPLMSDLRDSGSIEQEADIVIMLYRDDYYNPDSPEKGVCELIIAKHRNGPVGTVKLLFQPSQTKFFNLAKQI